jgi:hypothetical protein
MASDNVMTHDPFGKRILHRDLIVFCPEFGMPALSDVVAHPLPSSCSAGESQQSGWFVSFPFCSPFASSDAHFIVPLSATESSFCVRTTSTLSLFAMAEVDVAVPTAPVLTSLLVDGSACGDATTSSA